MAAENGIYLSNDADGQFPVTSNGKTTKNSFKELFTFSSHDSEDLDVIEQNHQTSLGNRTLFSLQVLAYLLLSWSLALANRLDTWTALALNKTPTMTRTKPRATLCNL